MAKIKWDRIPKSSVITTEYWSNPTTGFDKEWHEKKKTLNKKLGIHGTHNWEAIKLDSGPHVGKAVCNTCGGKFIMWLPKNYFTNT